MSPIIHLVRHGEGCHNVAKDWSIRDPDLTKKGVAQCDALNDSTADLQSRITHLVSSPSYRCVWTTLRSFSAVANRPLEIIINPDVMEVADDPCNIPLDKESLEDKADEWIDTKLLERSDCVDRGPTSPYRKDWDCVMKRAAKARVWLRETARQHVQENGKAAEIVVVSHADFLYFMTQESPRPYKPPTSLRWDNCEINSFRFVAPLGKDKNAYLQLINIDQKVEVNTSGLSGYGRGKNEPKQRRGEDNDDDEGDSGRRVGGTRRRGASANTRAKTVHWPDKGKLVDVREFAVDMAANRVGKNKST